MRTRGSAACAAGNRACRRPFRPPLGFGSFVGQLILAAAGFQPARPALDEFLGLPVAIPAEHEAEETLRSPVLRVCEPPERRLQARLPAPLHASNGQSREAAFQAGRTTDHLTQFARIFSGFVARGTTQRSPRNSSRTTMQALNDKARLPHERPNSGGELRSPWQAEACPTKSAPLL